MDKKTDSKNIVMHVLITVTKGHAASKGDAASQHVSEHLIAQSEGKKTIKKHCSARTIPVVTQHPFLFLRKVLLVYQENHDAPGERENVTALHLLQMHT